METHDVAAFAQIMAGLSELYGKSVSEALTEIYWTALKRFDMTAIRQAINAHINNPDTGQFMPKPADIARYLEGSSCTQGLQAWSKVLKAIQQVGPYETIVFDDVIIHAVICDMGGWVELCKLTEEARPFRGREFEKRYGGYVAQKPTRHPNVLTGLFAQESNRQDYPAKQPVLFGDAVKALQVYHAGIESAASYAIQRLPIENNLIVLEKSHES